MMVKKSATIKKCKVCGENLEMLFPNGPVFGMDRHPRMCECMRIKQEEEAKARATREKAELIFRNKSSCFSDKTMYDWNFQHDDHENPAMIHAQMYVKNFEEMKEKNIGYLFWGGVGTGKTFIAACIANALVDTCCTVKMSNFATIINDLFSCEDKSAYVDALVKYDLLIIYDLGAERNTEYAVENVFNVIDRRYRTGKPLIITTNLHLKMITNEQSVDKRRIYDRILELCTPVCVDGASKRAKASKEKMDQLKEMLKNYKEGELANE